MTWRDVRRHALAGSYDFAMYQPRRPARHRTVALRQASYHLREWGVPTPGQLPAVLLHGWMDVGASFQFVVDALAGDAWLVAPDWRGFGHSRAAPTDHFPFADYLADLDALLALLAADAGRTDASAEPAAFDLIGHSMGGNVAMAYAGVRPERVRRLVDIEGFGLPATRAGQAPERWRRWLDEVHRHDQGLLALATYDDADSVARRLMRSNPRLPRARADWLARQWAEPTAGGRWRILAEDGHKVVQPQRFRLDETLALYRAITAPVLCIEADGDTFAQLWPGQYQRAEFHRRFARVPRGRIVTVADAGHMVHHDQPEAVARHISEFLSAA